MTYFGDSVVPFARRPAACRVPDLPAPSCVTSLTDQRSECHRSFVTFLLLFWCEAALGESTGRRADLACLDTLGERSRRILFDAAKKVIEFGGDLNRSAFPSESGGITLLLYGILCRGQRLNLSENVRQIYHVTSASFVGF